MPRDEKTTLWGEGVVLQGRGGQTVKKVAP